MYILDNYRQLYDFAEDNAKELADRFLQPDRHKGWICPICGSGSGPHGTGLTLTKDGKHKGTFTCWRKNAVPCFGKHTENGESIGNILDIVGAIYGITDTKERDKKFCELFDVKIKEDKNLNRNDCLNDEAKVNPDKQDLPKVLQAENFKEPTPEEIVIKVLEESLEGKEGSVSDLFHKSNRQLNHPKAIKYITGRGISADNPFLRYMGYLEDHDCGLRWGENKFKGCIAFFGTNSSYAVRDIYPVPPGLEKTMKPSNKDNKHPDIPIGLLDVIKNKDKKLEGTEIPEPVFVVEGLFDAPSIAEAGADAIALNGTGNIMKIIWAFKKFNIERPLILALDNDEAGEKAQQQKRDPLEKAGIKFYEISLVPEKYAGKDPNDFLLADRANFINQVQNYRRLPLQNFDESLNAFQKDKLKAHLTKRAQESDIKTGFKTLDGVGFLDGGLYSALYVIGAISSLGKTTFILQLADQIATSGKDVVFFSLEMPKFEVMVKSVSRYTLKDLLENGDLRPDHRPDNRAKSLKDIYHNYLNDQDKRISLALDRYFNDTGKHLRIIEGMGNIDAEVIREVVEEHKKITGNAPVVFIDYLQLLDAPKDPITKRRLSMNDKQIVDFNIFKLKQISRDYECPIIGISSFNRDNYNEPVSMKSFKESGAIEYSSDVLIGLEPEYMGIANGQGREAKKVEYKDRAEKKGIKSTRLVILKNRSGNAGGVDIFDFYPRFNYFLERGNAERIDTFIGFSSND